MQKNGWCKLISKKPPGERGIGIGSLWENCGELRKSRKKCGKVNMFTYLLGSPALESLSFSKIGGCFGPLGVRSQTGDLYFVCKMQEIFRKCLERPDFWGESSWGVPVSGWVGGGGTLISAVFPQLFRSFSFFLFHLS